MKRFLRGLAEMSTAEEIVPPESNEFPHELYKAAEAGDVEALLAMLSREEAKRPDVNWQVRAGRGKGRTPLLIACRRGDDEFALMLLNAGAKPNVGNDGGVRPLHVAAAGGHVKCVAILLEHGADASLNDKQNRTPMNYVRRPGPNAGPRPPHTLR